MAMGDPMKAEEFPSQVWLDDREWSDSPCFGGKVRYTRSSIADLHEDCLRVIIDMYEHTTAHVPGGLRAAIITAKKRAGL